MKKILLIEDDEQIVELMDIHLKDIFCQSTVGFPRERGLHLALAEKFDLISLTLCCRT
jgi:DNA-binding response OmpR family regulator